MQHRPMQVVGGGAFIELEKLRGFVGISFRTAHPRGHRATSPVVLVIARSKATKQSRNHYMPLWIASLSMTIPTLVLLRPRARCRSCAARYIAVRRRRPSQLPLRERNVLLVAAGYAPAVPQGSLDDPALKSARAAIELAF